MALPRVPQRARGPGDFDFRPPELDERTRYCCSKLPGEWCFVRAATGTEHSFWCQTVGHEGKATGGGAGTLASASRPRAHSWAAPGAAGPSCWWSRRLCVLILKVRRMTVPASQGCWADLNEFIDVKVSERHLASNLYSFHVSFNLRYCCCYLLCLLLSFAGIYMPPWLSWGLLE